MTLTEVIEILVAVKNGGDLELLCGPDNSWTSLGGLPYKELYRLISNGNTLRIERSPVAPGHNPDQLTVEQVGKGWRLLTEAEQSCCSADRASKGGIQTWSQLGGSWVDGGAGAHRFCTYRTQEPEGYFLPKKKVLVSWTSLSQIPPGAWYRSRKPSDEGLVQRIVAYDAIRNMVALGVNPDKWYHLLYMKQSYEYSTDLVNWLPCGAYVEEVS